jgi:hypothetical protein
MSALQTILNSEYHSWVDTEAVSVTIYATSGGPGSGTTVSIGTASQLNEEQARRAFEEFSLTGPALRGGLVGNQTVKGVDTVVMEGQRL